MAGAPHSNAVLPPMRPAIRRLHVAAIPLLVLCGSAVAVAVPLVVLSAQDLSPDAPAQRYASAMTLAYAATQRGDTAAARHAFLRAIEADRSKAEPHIELGYLDLATGNRAAAADWFARGAVRAPQRADVRRQLGFVLIDLRRPQEAIAAFESIEQTREGLTDRDQLALAYLYDGAARHDDAQRAFRLAAGSPDTSVANPAQRALGRTGQAGTVLFSEGYLAPFHQTRFTNTIAFGVVRHGIEHGASWAPAAYTSLRVTRDSKSTGGGGQSQVLADNAAMLAAGMRVRPWHGPVWIYLEAGGAYALLAGESTTWRRDIRTGAFLITQDERRLIPMARWTLRTEVVADASWYERFDRNVIGSALLREGIRVGKPGTRVLDVFGRGWVGYDSRGDFFNRAVESGGGIALRIGPNVAFFTEGISGRFLTQPPAAVSRRYQDWRFTAVWGWRAVRPTRTGNVR